MRERRAFRGLPLAGMAAACSFLGHWLAYVVVIPHQHARASVLAQTGHGYWLTGVKLVVLLAASGLGVVVLRSLRGRIEPEPRSRDPYLFLLARLFGLQAVAFTAMEVAERLVAGAPVAQMFHHHLWFFGLALQLLVACAGAFVLLVFGRTVVRAIHAMREARRARAARRPFPRSASSFRRIPLLAGAGGVRGPPA